MSRVDHESTVNKKARNLKSPELPAYPRLALSREHDIY